MNKSLEQDMKLLTKKIIRKFKVNLVVGFINYIVSLFMRKKACVWGQQCLKTRWKVPGIWTSRVNSTYYEFLPLTFMGRALSEITIDMLKSKATYKTFHFQQDYALSWYLPKVDSFWMPTFRVIRLREKVLVEWSGRSLDLMTCDFFCWVTVIAW